MGIVNKQKSRALDNLERKDVEFILNKLRTATYIIEVSRFYATRS